MQAVESDRLVGWDHVARAKRTYLLAHISDLLVLDAPEPAPDPARTVRRATSVDSCLSGAASWRGPHWRDWAPWAKALKGRAGGHGAAGSPPSRPEAAAPLDEPRAAIAERPSRTAARDMLVPRSPPEPAPEVLACWRDVPMIERLTGADIKQTLVRRPARTTGTIEAMQYCFDSVDLSNELAAAVRRGVSVKLIVDRNKFYDPPGARQIEQLDLLVSWRVEVRTLTPENHPHAAQHSKTWLLDRSVYACGSANGTENSLNRCIEVVMWTSEGKTCEAAATDFVRWWIGRASCRERG